MSDFQQLLSTVGESCPATTPGPADCHGSLHGLVYSVLNPSDRFSDRSCDGVRCEDGASGECGDVKGVAPETPQRSMQNNTVAPLTPLANLKVLMAAAAASSELEEHERVGGGDERGVKVERGGRGEEEEGSVGGRKMKSLALLCKRFLSIVESDVGTGNEFSLDTMAQKLGTNRRRIYDIINVLEAVEMIVKQSKNWYCWIGRGGLLNTLAKLKAMAGDDPELVQWFSTDCTKENVAPPTMSVARQQGQTSVVIDEASQDSIPDEALCDDGQTRGGRWDKSLGILCQKFLMLFLVTPGHELTLETAGSILMPDDDSSSATTSSATSNPKTKVRRLYDIANVLTTLELIRKKTFLAPNHRKMPGYVWCGPNMADINAVSVCRKRDFPSPSAVYSRKLKGTALVRKSSLGGTRPFLNQYEVKDATSAPSTPYKTLGGRLVGNFTGGRGGGGIRRSLSFGGQSSLAGGGCGDSRRVGVACGDTRLVSPMTMRPLCPKAVDYMKEMKEFELVMKKHSHRYPNVVTVFQDFIHRYQTSLEQAVATGQTILLKPPSPPLLNYFMNFDPLENSTPQITPVNPTSNAKPSAHITDALVAKEQSHSLPQEDSGFESGNSLLGGALLDNNDVVGIVQPEVSEDDLTVSVLSSRPTLPEPLMVQPDVINHTEPTAADLATTSPLHCVGESDDCPVTPAASQDCHTASSNQATMDSAPSQLTSNRLSTVSSLATFPVLSFTKGTLQSPEKPFHAKSQAFVHVEDFLSALTSQKVESMLNDPRLVARAAHLPGVQPLSAISLLSQLLTTPQAPVTPEAGRRTTGCTPLPLNPSSLVNQQPIPATAEVKRSGSLSNKTRDFKPPSNLVSPPSTSRVLIPQLPPVLAGSVPLDFVSPDIQPPTTFLAPQTLPLNAPLGYVSLAPRIELSSFSMCAPPSSVTTAPPTVPVSEPVHGDVANGTTPKRIKLE